MLPHSLCAKLLLLLHEKNDDHDDEKLCAKLSSVRNTKHAREFMCGNYAMCFLRSARRVVTSVLADGRKNTNRSVGRCSGSSGIEQQRTEATRIARAPSECAHQYLETENTCELCALRCDALF